MEGKEYKRCLRCNRILKSEKARQRGYGNHCWALYNIEVKKQRKSLFDIYKADKVK